MANIKITDLPELTTPANADLIETVDDVAGTPISKKLSWTNIKAFLNYIGNVVEDTTPQLGGDLDGQGNYLINVQNIPDLAAKGAGYWFKGTDDQIDCGADAKIQFSGRPNFSLIAYVRAGNALENWDGIIDSSTGAGASADARLGIFYMGDQLRVFWGNGVSFGTLFPFAENSFVKDKNTVVGLTVNSSNEMKGYLNGKQSGSATVVSDLAVTSNWRIGKLQNVDGQVWHGTICQILLYNIELTATEIKTFSSVPYKYIGASQTELMPNQVDRDFSGASAWADVDLNAYNETDDLTITANAADQYCTLLVASAPTIIGKRYKLTYDLANIVSTWTVKSFDGTQTIGTISANATQGSLEWTATTTGGYRIVSVAADSSGDFDNFTLTQIGCVAQYEQSGIGHNQWLDNSGNELHGVVSGALPINLPANHREKYVDLAVTANTTFTLPLGYQITSIIVRETAGNAITGGLDVGYSAGSAEIVNAMAVGANAEVNCTLIATGVLGANFDDASDVIHIAATTNWNSASIKVRVIMQKII